MDVNYHRYLLQDRANELEKCWSCAMPQPEDYRVTLHLEDCPEHDEETCLVCVAEKSESQSGGAE